MDQRVEDLPGMKLSDFKDAVLHGKCLGCGRPVGECGLAFYRLRLEQCVLHPTNIRRQQGLAMFLGSASIAAVMGPDEDMAKVLAGPFTIIICQGCALSERGLVAILAEQACKNTEEEASDGQD